MWLGHVAIMSSDRRAKQVMNSLNWAPGKKGRMKNWPETIREDLRRLTYKDAL